MLGREKHFGIYSLAVAKDFFKFGVDIALVFYHSGRGGKFADRVIAPFFGDYVFAVFGFKNDFSLNIAILCAAAFCFGREIAGKKFFISSAVGFCVLEKGTGNKIYKGGFSAFVLSVNNVYSVAESNFSVAVRWKLF